MNRLRANSLLPLRHRAEAEQKWRSSCPNFATRADRRIRNDIRSNIAASAGSDAWTFDPLCGGGGILWRSFEDSLRFCGIFFDIYWGFFWDYQVLDDHLQRCSKMGVGFFGIVHNLMGSLNSFGGSSWILWESFRIICHSYTISMDPELLVRFFRTLKILWRSFEILWPSWSLLDSLRLFNVLKGIKSTWKANCLHNKNWWDFWPWLTIDI